MQELTPETIHRLRTKHRIDPIGETPWIKGFTGGSDDHAALFIGHTCTLAPAETPEEFLQCLRDRMTQAEGRNSNYRAFAFSIYKIAYDFSQSKSQDTTSNLLNQISSSLFDRDRLGIFGRLRLNLHKRRTESDLNRMVIELLEKLRNNSEEQNVRRLRSSMIMSPASRTNSCASSLIRWTQMFVMEIWRNSSRRCRFHSPVFCSPCRF